MRFALKIHPDSVCAAVARIDGEVVRTPSGGLTLRYVVSGAIGDLVLPPQAAPARADELWRHTCFEAFVRAPNVAAYTEFNFAPSAAWAAYRFSGYREGMAAEEVGAPHIEAQATGERYTLQATLAALPWPRDLAWQLGLSAVIEEAGGRKSYWALAHPPGKADFHHADCFALELPSSENS